MLNFLIFLYLQAFKISCSVELSMKKFIISGPDSQNRVDFDYITRTFFIIIILLYKNIFLLSLFYFVFLKRFI